MTRTETIDAMFGLSEQELTSLLSLYGYWVVLVFVTVESMGVPVPGESVLLAASVYAGTTHHLQIQGVVAAAAAGAILGDNIGFHLGRWGGYRLVHRFGSYIRVDERKLSIGRYLFTQHGGKVVFFGRFLPVLRIWAAFLAGTHRMAWQRFLLFNAAGGVLWAALMGTAAYAFGKTAAQVGGSAGFGLAVLATCGMGGFCMVLHRKQDKMARAHLSCPA